MKFRPAVGCVESINPSHSARLDASDHRKRRHSMRGTRRSSGGRASSPVAFSIASRFAASRVDEETLAPTEFFPQQSVPTSDDRPAAEPALICVEASPPKFFQPLRTLRQLRQLLRHFVRSIRGQRPAQPMLLDPAGDRRIRRAGEDDASSRSQSAEELRRNDGAGPGRFETDQMQVAGRQPKIQLVGVGETCKANVGVFRADLTAKFLHPVAATCKTQGDSSAAQPTRQGQEFVAAVRPSETAGVKQPQRGVAEQLSANRLVRRGNVVRFGQRPRCKRRRTASGFETPKPTAHALAEIDDHVVPAKRRGDESSPESDGQRSLVRQTLGHGGVGIQIERPMGDRRARSKESPRNRREDSQEGVGAYDHRLARPPWGDDRPPAPGGQHPESVENSPDRSSRREVGTPNPANRDALMHFAPRQSFPAIVAAAIAGQGGHLPAAVGEVFPQLGEKLCADDVVGPVVLIQQRQAGRRRRVLPAGRRRRRFRRFVEVGHRKRI